MNLQALAYLQNDPLHNVVLLKMLHAFSSVIQAYYTAEGASQWVLLLLPIQAFSYDAKTYPDPDFVVLLSTSNAAACARLLPYVPTNCKLVFKLMDAHEQQVIAQQLPLQRVRAFHSYTRGPGSYFTPATNVHIIAFKKKIFRTVRSRKRRFA